MPKQSDGCKYLRELHFNPQSHHGCATGTDECPSINPVMPRLVAYILRQLKQLRICDLERLSDGLEYYLHGPENGYHPKLNRIANLKLTHFQGASEKLTEEMLQVM